MAFLVSTLSLKTASWTRTVVAHQTGSVWMTVCRSAFILFLKNNCSVCLKVIVTNLKKYSDKIKELWYCILNMQKENCRNGRAVKKRQRRSVCVYLYNSVLFCLFMACDLVHELLSSVAAEKQRCYFMNSPFNKYDAVYRGLPHALVIILL